MILKIITIIFLSLTFYNGISFFKKEPGLLKKIYFGNIKDYFWAFLLFLGVVLLTVPLSFIKLPGVLTFSWLKLIGSKSGNLIVNPGTNTDSSIGFLLLVLFYLALIFFLPYLAKLEEMSFRYMKFELKDRVISSIKFGFMHMIVGVPVIAAIILSFIGFIFSIKYVNSFESRIKKYEDDPSDNDYRLISDEAIDDVTSLHTKYNFIIISLVLVITFLSHYYE